METAPTIEERHAVPTAGELVFRLHNSFDVSCPPDWGDEAIERIYADWAQDDVQDETSNDSIFWSRVFVTFVILAAVAWVAMSMP